MGATIDNAKHRRKESSCQKPLPALHLNFALQHHREVMSSATNKLFSCFASKIETHHPCFGHNNITLNFRVLTEVVYSLTLYWHQTCANIDPKTHKFFSYRSATVLQMEVSRALRSLKNKTPLMWSWFWASPSYCSIMCPRCDVPTVFGLGTSWILVLGFCLCVCWEPGHRSGRAHSSWPRLVARGTRRALPSWTVCLI